MKIVHALQPLVKSIFLAGPTPRDPDVKSWRPEAIEIIEQLGFTGSVLVPESSNWAKHKDYDAQINWEWEAINQATVVLFWIPRDLATMPAFTTNIEFGMLAASGKVVLGFPKDAPKLSYLAALASKHGVPQLHTLRRTVFHAVNKADDVHRASLAS